MVLATVEIGVGCTGSQWGNSQGVKKSFTAGVIFELSPEKCGSLGIQQETKEQNCRGMK